MVQVPENLIDSDLELIEEPDHLDDRFPDPEEWQLAEPDEYAISSPVVADFAQERARRAAPRLEVQLDRLDTTLVIGSDVEIARTTKAWLIKKNGHVVFADGHFWRYHATHWVKIGPEHLRVAVHKFDGVKIGPGGMDENGRPIRQPTVKLNKSKVDSVINELSAILAKPDFFASPALGINCRSGFIKFGADGVPTLEKHSPDHRCRHVIGATWPLAERPAEKTLLDRLLAGCFDGDADAGDKRDLIAEIAGCAALGYATKLIKPKAVVLFGQTAENGKSQILDMLRGLLPEDAVSSVTLGKLGDDKYAVHLVGKLLNASDELTSAAAISSDAFKTVVTGEPVSCRDVYQSAITFRPIAQQVFATNDLPSFRAGMDRGVIRRLLVIGFNRSIPEDERIEHIGSRIAKEEADLLLDFAVAGATRLIARRAYPEIDSSKRALRDWVEGVDPVAAWLASDAIEITGDGAHLTLSRDLYENFRAWSNGEGYADASLPRINQFSQRLVAGNSKIVQKRQRTGRYFAGVRLVA